jgi:iron uptake system component EfeO
MFAGAVLFRDWKVVFAACALNVAASAVSAGIAQVGPLEEAVEQYRQDVIKDIHQALAGARDMRDRIAAGDIAGAQRAWINSRVGWERSEVFTGSFVPALDEAIDAWPDAVAGYHGIEAKLFGSGRSDIRDEPDMLIKHLVDLDVQLRTMKLTPQGLLNGIVRLAYEVGDSKIDGGESRYSGTSLNDMRNNVDGIEFTWRILFASRLQAADPKSAALVRAEIDQLKTVLDTPDLKSVDPDSLRKASEALIVDVQTSAPELGLGKPTLEDIPQ